MVLPGHNLIRRDQSAAPSGSYLCTKLGVACWMSGHCCHSTVGESQPWKLYLATLGGDLSLVSPCTVPKLSLVACLLAFPSYSPPEPGFHIDSKSSQPTVTDSIQHCRNCPTAARCWKSPNNLQPPSPSAGVRLAAVSDSSVPVYRTDASSQETQPPILCSVCWKH